MSNDGHALISDETSFKGATSGLDRATESKISSLLAKLEGGNSSVAAQLFTLAYDSLHAIAHSHRSRWQGDMTYNTTTILHESFLKLVDNAQAEWESTTHFISVAAKAMRHVLVDYARRRKTVRRGGLYRLVSLNRNDRLLDQRINMSDEKADRLIALDAAMRRLEAIHPREANVVQCRFFGGMTIQETAAALKISTATVSRDWEMAQAWLMREMVEEDTA